MLRGARQSPFAHQGQEPRASPAPPTPSGTAGRELTSSLLAQVHTYFLVKMFILQQEAFSVKEENPTTEGGGGRGEEEKEEEELCLHFRKQPWERATFLPRRPL